MDHQRWGEGSFFPAPTLPGGKSPGLGLAVGQHIVACRLHPCVCAIGSQLVEKDELPDCSPVLGSISWAWFDPEPLWLLSGEDGGNGVGLHCGGARLPHKRRTLWLIEELA